MIQIGDRVKVYTALLTKNGGKGCVTDIDNIGMLTVRLDRSWEKQYVHPKQCRKIKLKKLIMGVAAEPIKKGQVVCVDPENGLVKVSK